MTYEAIIAAKDQIIADKDEMLRREVAGKDELIAVLKDRIADLTAGAENDKLTRDRMLHDFAGLVTVGYLYGEALAAVNMEYSTLRFADFGRKDRGTLVKKEK
jgi:hypothetical protein